MCGNLKKHVHYYNMSSQATPTLFFYFLLSREVHNQIRTDETAQSFIEITNQLSKSHLKNSSEARVLLSHALMVLSVTDTNHG